ncbi:MAG: hypothetical protein N4A68_15095 [Maledivibacter sp.]|nr:hypothetical protein [Maledivibacter sp.]
MHEFLKLFIEMKKEFINLAGVIALIVLIILIVIEYFIVKIRKPQIWLELKLFGILAVVGIALVLNNSITSTIAIIIMGTFICSERFLERISAIVMKSSNYRFENGVKTDIQEKINRNNKVDEHKSIDLINEKIELKSNLLKPVRNHLDIEKREHVLKSIDELSQLYGNSKLFMNIKMIKKKETILYDSILELESGQVVMFEIRESSISKIGFIEKDVKYMLRELRKYYGKQRNISCVAIVYSDEDFDFYTMGDICILKSESAIYDTFKEVRKWIDLKVG